MAVRRRFTQEFKLAVVREYLAGGVSRAALARQYDVAPGQEIGGTLTAQILALDMDRFQGSKSQSPQVDRRNL